MSDVLLRDLETMDDERIHSIIASAQSELDRRRKICVSAVQDKIKVLADSLGMTPEEVIGKMPRASRGRNQQKRIVRYRNTKNPSETWTGRGKRPQWLKSALQTGAQLETFRVS